MAIATKLIERIKNEFDTVSTSISIFTYNFEEHLVKLETMNPDVPVFWRHYLSVTRLMMSLFSALLFFGGLSAVVAFSIFINIPYWISALFAKKSESPKTKMTLDQIDRIINKTYTDAKPSNDNSTSK